MAVRTSRISVAAVMIAAVFVAYAGTFKSPFVFDDVPSILSNATIQGFWRAWRPPSEFGVTVAGRPLVNVSLALDYALSGTAVWSYHLTNLLIHLGSAIILFDCIRLALRAIPLASRYATHAIELSFAVAALWALHPLQTEAITYIIQRAESLMAFFYLATLWCFVRSVQTGASSAWRYATAIVCLAGMATKEVMVSAPLMVALYDRLFAAGSWPAVWKQRRGLLLALGSTWIVLIALVVSTSGRGGTAGLGTVVTPFSYALTQAYAVGHYLRLAIWPAPLVFDYGTGLVTRWEEVLLPGVIVTALAAMSFLGAWRGKPWAFCGVFFFCVLAPSSSFVPVATQTIAEHRMYLPLAGVLTAAVLVGYAYLGRLVLWVSGLAACALAIATFERNGDYRDLLTLWGDTATKCPTNVRALNNYALELQKAGRPEEANREFARAVALDPKYVSAHSNWGAALLAQKHPLEAIEHLETAVRLAPAYADARLNLGNALSAAGRSSEAIAQFQAALELEPDAGDAHFNLALALDLAGQRQAAAEHFKIALAKRPDLLEAHFRLARIAEDGGHVEDAQREYEEVLRRDPKHAGAEAGLGVLLARSGNMTTAEEHLKNAVRLRPDDPDTLSNLGNVHLLQGDARQAISDYEASLRIRPEDVGTRQNLEVARETLAGGAH